MMQLRMMQPRNFCLFYKAPLALTVTLGLALTAFMGSGWALSPQSRQYYMEAQQAELHGKLEQAEQALRKAVALDSQDYLNFVKLASILNQLGKPNEALSYYQQALNLNPQDSMILYSMGGIYEQMGQYAKAQEAYDLCLQNNPRYQFALLNLARTEIQQKKYPPAIAHYQQFLGKYPDHYEARRHLAKLYLVTGQETASVKEFDILKQRFPNRFEEHLDLARALTGSNAPEQALEELKLAYAKEGSKSDIDEEMGRAHSALGQVDLAIQNYQKALALNPKKDDLLPRIADLYRAQKQWGQAAENYQQYLKAHPDAQGVRQSLATTYLDAGNYEAALNELGLLLQATTDPQQRFLIQKDMAYSLQMLGDMPKAIALSETLLSDPMAQKDLQLKSNLAIAYHREGQYDKAVDFYKQVYYADPALRQQFKINRESLGNDLSVALTALGDSAYKAKDFKLAVSRYGDARLTADAKNFYPDLGLANTYYAMELFEQSNDAYGKVLEKDPGNVTAKLYRTKLAMARTASSPTGVENAASVGVSDTNINTLESLAQQNPTNQDVLLTLANAYERQGNTTAAINTYQKLLALDANNPDLLSSIGTLWQQAGNLEKAREHYLKALALNDRMPFVHYNLGIVYNELGQLDQSADAYKKAMSLDPANSDSRYGLAITLEKQRKYQEALDTYQSYTKEPTAKYTQEAMTRIELLKQALGATSNVKPASAPAGAGQMSAAPAGSAAQSGITPQGAPSGQPAKVQQAPQRIEPLNPANFQ